MNPLPQSFATVATSRHLAEITYQWNATGVFMVCLCVIVPVRDNTINRFFSNPIFLKMTTRSNNSPPLPQTPINAKQVLCCFLNLYLLRLYSSESDDGKAYFAKGVCIVGLLLAECACLALPLDQANSKRKKPYYNSPPMQPHHSPDTISPCFPVFRLPPLLLPPPPPSPPRNRFGDDWLRDVSIRLLWFSG
jgi:hypothetical protein